MRPDQKPFAAVVVVERDGLVLSVSRKGKPEEKGLPGGRIEDGEDPSDTARRELLEETGIRVGEMELVFDSLDDVGVRVIAYRALHVLGPAEQRCEAETGLVEWIEPRLFVTSSPFSTFNASLFKLLGIEA